MASAAAARVMEKPVPLQQQQQQQQQNQQPQPQQQALKCPRCDSSNTKFCYYNNYSLSQPRHFCKACKRYWTRGGTLRNVPVGGGCRKNKRVKRPITAPSTASVTSATLDHHHHHHNISSSSGSLNPNPNPNLDHLPSSTSSNNNSNHHLNPLFYGLLGTNPSFPRFDARVSSVNDAVVSGYDVLQSPMNGLGLGFSSSSAQLLGNHHAQNSSNSVLSSYPSIFGGSTSSSNSAPTMASLLASSLQQQQRFMGFAPYEDMKDMKIEGTENRMDWSSNGFHGQNSNDQIEAVGSADPNSLLWSTSAGGGGGWLDPTTNIGSSVPSLI